MSYNSRHAHSDEPIPPMPGPGIPAGHDPHYAPGRSPYHGYGQPAAPYGAYAQPHGEGGHWQDPAHFDADPESYDPDGRRTAYYDMPPDDDDDDDYGYGYDGDGDEGDLSDMVRRNREPAADSFPEPTEPAEKAKGKPRRVPWKFIITVGGATLLCCGLMGPRFYHKNENGYTPGGQVEAEGPNMLPNNPIKGEPMGTAEQRAAHVQRAVNNGEYGKTVHTLPGELTATGSDGRTMTVRNPIIVTEGLPADPGKFDLKNGILDGRIFGLTEGGFDATKGVGQSYGVVPVDPTSVVKWEGATSPDEVVDVELAWQKDAAGAGLKPKSDTPYMQNNKTGKVLPPGSPDNDRNDLYMVGHVG